MAKVPRSVIYTALFAVVAYGVFVLTEPDKPHATTKHKVAGKKAGAKADGFTPQDYSAKFPRVADAPRDAFRPLIMGAAQGKMAAMKLDILPLTFTGGDANWRYSGTAEVNGVREALLENSATGESVFLRLGQSWKHAVLSKIESESIVMTGPGGVVQRLRLGEEEVAKVAVRPGTQPGTLTPIQTARGNRNNSSSGGGGGGSATPNITILGGGTSSFDDGGPGGGPAFAPGGPPGGPGGPGGPGFGPGGGGD